MTHNNHCYYYEKIITDFDLWDHLTFRYVFTFSVFWHFRNFDILWISTFWTIWQVRHLRYFAILEISKFWTIWQFRLLCAIVKLSTFRRVNSEFSSFGFSSFLQFGMFRISAIWTAGYSDIFDVLTFSTSSHVDTLTFPHILTIPAIGICFKDCKPLETLLEENFCFPQHKKIMVVVPEFQYLEHPLV